MLQRKINAIKFDNGSLSWYISAMKGTPSRHTRESFCVCYYDGMTGEEISSTTFLNNTGKVKDTVEIAIDNKPEYNGLVLWDINKVEEE